MELPQSRSRLPPRTRTAEAAAGKNLNLNLSLMSPRKAYSRSAASESKLRRRRRHGSKEVVRRALMQPPSQKPSWRWRNFTPTPTRFSAVDGAAAGEPLLIN
ncbi:uncharacterized protein LOC127266035 [Andrographis paniculata]|uniref:uncharacterized protein LOC127266035 n=1 Tax=Andrographis paniculata TaxID=175694 RepID=UPI0021E96257|nr:uncharacterized protein LOC127266035 [Andrographis paniculata]